MRDWGLYVGCTGKNVHERVSRHNKGQVMSTKQRRPLVLIHCEKYKSKIDAFNRERFLKSLWSGRVKKKIKESYIKENGLWKKYKNYKDRAKPQPTA